MRSDDGAAGFLKTQTVIVPNCLSVRSGEGAAGFSGGREDVSEGPGTSLASENPIEASRPYVSFLPTSDPP